MPEQANPKYHSIAVEPPRSVAHCAHPYAELSVTTNFSFLRGASHPDEMVYEAAHLGYRAIAITDRNSLAGVVRAHTAAKSCGLKLLIGTRLELTDAPDVLVWATDRDAYARLSRLLTTGKRRAEKGGCILSAADLSAASGGLLAAAVAGTGDALGPLKDIFDRRLSLAVAAEYGENDAAKLRTVARTATAYGIPLLATNDVHYHDPGRRKLQDVLTCIRHGCTITDAGYRLFSNGERYLKPPAHMHRLFADHPRAIYRGIEIAEQCAFSLDELKYEYPDEVVPAGVLPIEHLKTLTWAGAAYRYPGGVPSSVQEQLHREFAIIEKLKYEPYFLTVYDLVRFARSRNILCQGRGSAANSAVCYCLGVTAVDPARIDVLFERFVSAARNEPPDIDVDFEHERREEVIQYVYEKYGRDRAGMTATLITYRGRSAVRDVGKAMGLGLDLVDHLAKQVEGWSSGIVSDEQIRAAGLDPADRTVRLVIGLTNELLGFPRHLSQHTGGMVMTRGPLCELVPIENAAMADRTVIEWDKDDIDALGLLKVDVLALGMLTALAKALKLVNDNRPDHSPLELATIPAEDPAVYDMVSDADTVGVFQIESRAQMSMLPRLRPREFYDLVIEVAIVRPGPIQGDMVHPYLRRRQQLEPVEFPSEALRSVLGKTLGVPLFQEQAMRIAIVCAGFSPEDADRLRRAVTGFRRYGDIETFGRQFINGMLERGYEKEFAERCFNQLKGFSSYGFPESHAASFALLVYASSWIKRHHPAAFCAALLNSQPMGFYAPARLVRDAKEHGVTVQPVDVNYSQWDCTLEPARENVVTGHGKQLWGNTGPAVRLGFREIRGIREAESHRLVLARGNRPFKSITDLWRRTSVSVTSLRKLADADAFGSLGLSRRDALWQAMRMKDDDAPLFDLTEDAEVEVALPTMPLGQEIRLDYATAGLSLKAHPMSLIRERLSAMNVIPAIELARREHGQWATVAGLVLIRQRPGTASGIVFVTLEDETGIANLVVMPDVYSHYRAAAKHGTVMLAEGRMQKVGQVIHILAYRLHDIGHEMSGTWGRSRDFR